jgi:hypothetical protein
LAAPCFFSRKLTDTESHYSTFDSKLLAAQAAIKPFQIHHFCKGHVFQLWTDHKPLVTALSRALVPILPRQQRHAAFISEFNIQLFYLPGLKNVVADFLSRPSPESTATVAATAVSDPVDFKEMAAEQTRCAERQRLLGGTFLQLTGAQCLAGDVSTGFFCPVVPLNPLRPNPLF